jgi:hypothetical protein
MVFETSENYLIAFEIIYKYKLMVIIRFLNTRGGGWGRVIKSVFLNDL